MHFSNDFDRELWKSNDFTPIASIHGLFIVYVWNVEVDVLFELTRMKLNRWL